VAGIVYNNAHIVSECSPCCEVISLDHGRPEAAGLRIEGHCGAEQEQSPSVWSRSLQWYQVASQSGDRSGDSKESIVG
jgi:hypothetical protein